MTLYFGNKGKVENCIKLSLRKGEEKNPSPSQILNSFLVN